MPKIMQYWAFKKLFLFFLSESFQTEIFILLIQPLFDNSSYN